MLIQLLRTIPVSGSFKERHYNVSAGANAWVKFATEAGVEWVGVFGSGERSRFYQALPFGADRGRTACIIAGGQGYVVDTESGDQLRETPWRYGHAAIAVPDRDFVIVADDTEIWAAGRSGDRYAWRSEPAWYDYGVSDRPHRVALDGIIVDAATKDEVRGKIWEGDGWFEFRLLLPDLELIRGWCLSEDWGAFDLRSPSV